MKFEWDIKKSKANRAKHGIDFETAKEIWVDKNRLEIQAPFPVEDRVIIIGKLHNKLWTVIYTMRGDTIRIISVRRSRKKEAKLYDREKVG
ncbi:MAG: BrnT family toxin [Nitrospirota bacterium]